jgi:hypothetical protein
MPAASFAKSARRRSISGGAVNTVLRIGGDRSTRPGAAAAIQCPKNNSQITAPHNVANQNTEIQTSTSPRFIYRPAGVPI